jgi:hypothetical protein
MLETQVSAQFCLRKAINIRRKFFSFLRNFTTISNLVVILFATYKNEMFEIIFFSKVFNIYG